MTSIRKLLGSNIKAYRSSLGISQEKLAEMIDMAANYLGLIEGGKKFPSADMIERIAAALGKDPPDLFTVIPIQQDWKKHILLKIDTLINEEFKALQHNRCLCGAEAADCDTKFVKGALQEKPLK